MFAQHSSREARQCAGLPARGVEVIRAPRARVAKRIVAGLLGELETIAAHLPDLEGRDSRNPAMAGRR